MRNLKSTLMVCLTSTAIFAASAGETELQIQKFRFNRHVKLGFERLVIEFASKSAGKSNPVIRLVPDSAGKETTVHVSQATLVGAIPESAINDSYVKKSQYFGPVSISSDSSNGFEIRTFIKQSHSIVDAFWLEKPSRLIVDVFPKTSDRAQGPNMVVKRSTASIGNMGERKRSGNENKSEEKDSTAPAWTQMDRPTDESVLCFPANTQVRANIGFEKGVGPTSAANNVDSTYSAASSNTQDLIVCYPKGAQVTPHLKFAPSETPFFGRADLDNRNGSNRNPSSAPPFYPGAGGGYQPQPFPMMGYPNQNFYSPPPRPSFQPNLGSRDSMMNSDADIALSSPEDGRMGYQESFSQKAPPMSLGKKLLPPGQR